MGSAVRFTTRTFLAQTTDSHCASPRAYLYHDICIVNSSPPQSASVHLSPPQSNSVQDFRSVYPGKRFAHELNRIGACNGHGYGVLTMSLDNWSQETEDDHGGWQDKNISDLAR